MGIGNRAVVYGTPDLLDKVLPAGYKTCRKCMGTGRIANLSDLNDLDTIYFEPCEACGGKGYVRNYKQEDA